MKKTKTTKTTTKPAARVRALKPAGARAVAKPNKRIDLQRSIMLREVKDAPDWLTRDITRVIPQLSDVLDGLLRDTDELLLADAGAYDFVYDDDQIAASLDNAFLPVGQATFNFEAPAAESQALIPAMQMYCLRRPGWSELIQDLCYAEVEGLRLSRMVWKNVGTLNDPIFVVDRFTPKDKRRFRPGDPDWKNVYLIDDGAAPVGMAGGQGPTGFRRPLVREHFIVHRWRNTEDRNGWGKGIGARLYRLAKYRRPLIHLLLQTLENLGGGIRYVQASNDGVKGYTPGEWSTAVEAIRKELDEAKSGDTVILPPGFQAQVFFPQGTVGEALQKAVDGYVDQQIGKTINGATLTEDQGRVGSYGLGKEHSKTVWRRLQARAERVAETLQTDYVQTWLFYNPWVYAAAGVPSNTPAPILRATVSGGDSLIERSQVVNLSKAPILKSEYYSAHGVTQPTEEQIAAGETITPATAGPVPGDPLASPLGGLLGRRAPWNARVIEKASRKGKA